MNTRFFSEDLEDIFVWNGILVAGVFHVLTYEIGVRKLID